MKLLLLQLQLYRVYSISAGIPYDKFFSFTGKLYIHRFIRVIYNCLHQRCRKFSQNPFLSSLYLFIYLFKWIERENAFTPQFRWIYENIFSEKRQLSERTKTKDNGIGWEQSRLLERFAPVERHASPRAQIVTRLLRRKLVRRMYVGRFACANTFRVEEFSRMRRLQCDRVAHAHW